MTNIGCRMYFCNNMGLWSQTPQVQILTLPLTKSITLGKFPNLFVPQFPHLSSGGNNITCFTCLLCE